MNHPPPPALRHPPPPPPAHHIDLLRELIRSEKTFTNDLYTVISRIAAAYSPSNFPPAHLDRHFRLIEAIFRAHKAFLTQSIQPIDPPHPTYPLLTFLALFTQLLRHLLPVYHRYCHPTGWAGAGGWSRDPHVASNQLLIHTLLSLDWPASIPPSPPIFPEAPYPADDLLLLDAHSTPHASLTVFFALPFARLFYYRKLAHFFLHSLQHGRPEHKSAYDSAQQISLLIDRGRAQWSISPLHPPADPIASQQRPAAAAAAQLSPPRQLSPVPPTAPLPQTHSAPVPPALRSSTETALSGLAESSIGSTTDEVFDRTNPSTPLSSSSHTFEAQQQANALKPQPDMVQVNRGVFVQQAIINLQTQLDTSRCLDIFSMAPKQCRLLLAPPTLAYSRSLRYSGDARFKLRPQSDPNREVETPSGRLILITDLLMFCEYKEQCSPNHPNMWLMYPPLAGKHLQVNPVGSETDFEVIAMGKEAVRVSVNTQAERDAWVQHLQEAIEFGRQVALQKQMSPVAPAENRNQAPHEESSNSLKNPKLSALTNLSINGIPPRLGTQSQPISPSFSHRSERPPSSFSSHLEHQASQLASPPFPGQYSRSPSDAGGSLANQMAMHSLGPPPHAQNGVAGQPLRSPSTYSEGYRSQPAPPPSHSVGEAGHPGHPMAMRTLRKAPSAHALGARFDPRAANLPPMPMPMPTQPSEDMRHPAGVPAPIRRSTSTEPYRDRQYRPPSAAIQRVHERPASGATSVSRASRPLVHGGARSDDSDSESAASPEDTQQQAGPAVLAAEMKTKVFLKQAHSQWKALGPAKLRVFVQKPNNIKQLVVAADKGNKTLISTIVLSDGVERVGRTGVAVDISDRGVRTGIVYMLQMKNDTSAAGLFEQLLEGSDRRPK
ncbi:hypothetical protein PtB15_12B523 [Puccinia triticina]|nr:hypothetical protein PtB15_12B523 [Puccinia triticina]